MIPSAVSVIVIVLVRPGFRNHCCGDTAFHMVAIGCVVYHFDDIFTAPDSVASISELCVSKEIV